MLKRMNGTRKSMRSKIICVLCIFLILFSITSVSNAHYYNSDDYVDYAEDIKDYDIEIHVNKDGSMDVAENITVNAQGGKIVHGIFRDFPTQYANKKVLFDLQNVLLDGTRVEYTTENIRRGIRIKIGDKYYRVSTGRHKYTILYRIERQLTYYDDFDELYWNLIGSGWDFAIEHCHAKIYFPEGTEFLKDKLKTFNGKYGEKGTKYPVESRFIDEENAVEFEINEYLDPFEAFTVSIAFNKGAVIEPDFKTKIRWFTEDNLISMLLAMFLVMIVIWQYISWHKLGIDPEKRVVIPKYRPPEGFDVAEIAYIDTLGQVGQNKLLESIILNLAVKDYIYLEKSYKYSSMVIKKINSQDENPKRERLSGLENYVYSKLNNRETLESSETRFNRFNEMKKHISETLKDKYEKKLFYKNTTEKIINGILWVMAILISFIIGAIYNPFAAKMYLTNAIVIIPLAGALLVLILLIRHKLKINLNYLIKFFLYAYTFLMTFLPLLVMLIDVMSSFVFNMMTLITILAIALNNYIFLKIIPRYTEEGIRIKEEIDGFRMFIKTASDEDFKYKTPENFDKYFPYAFAIGMENKWANKFEDVLKTENYRPAWCSRHCYHNTDIFVATSFSKSFSSSFSTGISRAITAPPKSSGSYGGGSFGGGGSSGGGFSGGGGGGRRPEVAGKNLRAIIMLEFK